MTTFLYQTNLGSDYTLNAGEENLESAVVSGNYAYFG